MSIFQKRVDALIKKELEDLKEKKSSKSDKAKEIHKKQTTQSKINELIEQQKKNRK